MQITVASIERKEKRSLVVTTEGKKIGCWTDKLGKFMIEPNSTYEVETEDAEFNGRTLTNIVKAKRIIAAPPAATATNGGGHHTGCKDEQIFVAAILKSLIEAGEVKNDKTQLWATTQMLRGLWRHTFGFIDPAPGMQAAE